MGERASDHSKVFSPGKTGSSILEMTVRSLCSARVSAGLVVVLRPHEIERAKEELENVVEGEELLFVAGGETRQESVFHGLRLVQGKADYVLVHDGARPLCPADLIKQVVEQGLTHGAAILARPVSGTLKSSNPDQFIEETISREGVWEAQTPQVFSFDLLWQAHERAAEEGYIATDDSRLVERLGQKVKLVSGSWRNLKITTAEDLELMHAIERLG